MAGLTLHAKCCNGAGFHFLGVRDTSALAELLVLLAALLNVGVFDSHGCHAALGGAAPLPRLRLAVRPRRKQPWLRAWLCHRWFSASSSDGPRREPFAVRMGRPPACHGRGHDVAASGQAACCCCGTCRESRLMMACHVAARDAPPSHTCAPIG
jgi:hypothetical protein